MVNASIYPMLLIGGRRAGEPVPAVLRRAALRPDLRGRGGDLPFFSRLLLDLGPGRRQARAVVLGVLALAGRRRRCMRCACANVRSRASATRCGAMPALGERMKVYQLARFYRTIGMLLRGGMPLVARSTWAPSCCTRCCASASPRASRAISEGRGVAQSLDANGLATPVALRMLAVGERSGNMGEMMEQIAALPRRGDGALGRLVHAPVRADADGGDRPGDRRRSWCSCTCRSSSSRGTCNDRIDRRGHRAGAQAAAAARRRVVDVLEEALALEPDAFTARLAATLRLECLTHGRAAPPRRRRSTCCPSASARSAAASLLRAADGAAAARDRRPVLRRAAGLGRGAHRASRSAGAWCTAATSSPILAATRRRCARWTRSRPRPPSRATRTAAREDLSLKAIGDETSEVVRLVRSTLHDALKIGASDIHLETAAGGPGDQVPHRRRPHRRSS